MRREVRRVVLKKGYLKISNLGDRISMDGCKYAINAGGQPERALLPSSSIWTLFAQNVSVNNCHTAECLSVCSF